MPASSSSLRSSSRPKYGMYGLMRTASEWLEPTFARTRIRWFASSTCSRQSSGTEPFTHGRVPGQDHPVVGQERGLGSSDERADVGEQALGHVPRLPGRDQVTDGPTEGDVLALDQEDLDEGGQDQRHEEQDPHEHGQGLAAQT